jgi:hypothetical protein
MERIYDMAWTTIATTRIQLKTANGMEMYRIIGDSAVGSTIGTRGDGVTE